MYLFCARIKNNGFVILLIIIPRQRRSDLSRESRNAIRIRNIANETTEEEEEISLKGQNLMGESYNGQTSCFSITRAK